MCIKLKLNYLTMKRKNFPGRKKLRQLKAQGEAISKLGDGSLVGDAACIEIVHTAATKRTKKYKGVRC